MEKASEQREYEKAADLRDEFRAIDALRDRDLSGENLQPEQFYIDPSKGLERLGEILGMDAPLRTIEGIDIAHLQGGECCGSLVCFIDGRPFRHRYRRFRIRESAGDDDFAAVAEVVSRRYRRRDEDDELRPDAILIDGGKGQLRAAADALGDDAPFLMSLAKKEELLHLFGREDPIMLERRDPALRLLQCVRDEAHRFAQHYHHILRRKAVLGE
jgi:excinuclease ABC subunit C